MTNQFVLPDMHWQNIAEKAIQMFKDHLCNKLLPLAELTLNLLGWLKVAPQVSAWVYLFGLHDYNAMPLTPLGCANQMYDKPGKWKALDPHSRNGWYIGKSHELYRSFRVYKIVTIAESFFRYHLFQAEVHYNANSDNGRRSYQGSRNKKQLNITSSGDKL